jgi:hypothetical protein
MRDFKRLQVGTRRASLLARTAQRGARPSHVAPLHRLAPRAPFRPLTRASRCAHTWRCDAQKEPPPGISGTPTESNIMFWQAVIFGPEDTPWEGGAPCGARPRGPRCAGGGGRAPRGCWRRRAWLLGDRRARIPAGLRDARALRAAQGRSS